MNKTRRFSKTNGMPYAVGAGIAEAAKRKLANALNAPVFITHLPTGIRAYFNKKDPQDSNFTESAELILPGVGFVADVSISTDDLDELTASFARKGIDTQPYQWYLDLRKWVLSLDLRPDADFYDRTRVGHVSTLRLRSRIGTAHRMVVQSKIRSVLCFVSSIRGEMSALMKAPPGTVVLDRANSRVLVGGPTRGQFSS